MKKLLYFAFFMNFAFFGVSKANTETVTWMVDGVNYATTTCESGNDISLPNTPVKNGYTFIGWREVANRGTFSNWATVPTSTNMYISDGQTYIPKEYDYMIVEDVSDYPVGDFATPCRIVVTGGGVNNNTKVQTFGSAGEMIDQVTFAANCGKTINICWDNMTLYVDCGAVHGWSFDAIENVKYGNTFYLPGERVKRITRASSDDFIVYVNNNNPSPLSGTWRFVYMGNWETDGKTGWKPAEQLE